MSDNRQLATTGPSQLLRRSAMRRGGEIVPRRGRVVANAAFVLPMAIGTTMQIAGLTHRPGYLLAFMAIQVLPAVFFRRWRRLFERAAIWTASRLRNRAARPVRVVGTVRADSCFLTAVAQRPAVLARYRGGARGERADETRGVDFILACDDGRELTVRMSEHVFLDDAPPSVGAGELGECAVAPGDRVEIMGAEVAEVDPAADAGGLRETPLRVALCGADDAPLIVRPLERHNGLDDEARRSPFWSIT